MRASAFEQFTIAHATDKIRLAMEGLRELLLIQRLIARQTFELPCIDVPARLHQAGRSQATRVARLDQTREEENYYKGSAPGNTYEEAAAVAAAHRVLVKYFPAQQAALGAKNEGCDVAISGCNRKPSKGDPA